MANPRKHHYLPQFYLRRFSADGESIYQIEKKTGRFYGAKIRDTAAIRDFHEIDGNVDDPMALEKRLAVLEGELSVELDKLLACGVSHQTALAETIGLLSMLRMRVPVVKAHLEATMEAQIRQFGEAMERAGQLPPAPKGLEEALKFANLNIRISNWKCLELMFDLATDVDVIRILGSMRATLLHAPGGHEFFTCDQPVAFYHAKELSPYGVGPATPGVEISLPLSSQTLLLLKHEDGEDSEREATDVETQEFNRRTLVMADQYVFARGDALAVAQAAHAVKDVNAGFVFDMIPAGCGTYQLQRFVPVGPP